MFRSKLFLLFIIIISFIAPNLAIADSKVVGHMEPLPHELLVNPIKLQCGLVIREWRGTIPSLTEIKKLNLLCDVAKKAFVPFLAQHDIKPQHNKPFVWNLSIIPDGRCYRCMHDLHYRFKQRSIRSELWGYTGLFEEYIFTVSNTSMRYYNVIFTHELFHAFSMYYGVYTSHHPFDNRIRSAKDEKLAVGFTQYLGL